MKKTYTEESRDEEYQRTLDRQREKAEELEYMAGELSITARALQHKIRMQEPTSVTNDLAKTLLLDTFLFLNRCDRYNREFNQ